SLLAKRLGYQSEAAFCRAFKRVFGVSPGSVRSSADVAKEPVMNS
ncbi:MAG: AraC family transcriptional regulator, partial [Candidatus Thiodiazotropha endolucinida]